MLFNRLVEHQYNMPFSQLYKGEKKVEDEENIGPYSDALISVLKGLQEDTSLPYIDFENEDKHFLVYCPAHQNYQQKLKSLHPVVDLVIHFLDSKDVDNDENDPELLKNKLAADIHILKTIRFKHLIF